MFRMVFSHFEVVSIQFWVLENWAKIVLKYLTLIEYYSRVSFLDIEFYVLFNFSVEQTCDKF